MTLDHDAIAFIGTIIGYVILVAGAYWKLVVKMKELAASKDVNENTQLIKDRPTYSKVEEMINRELKKVITEEKVYQIVDREAYGKADGRLLEKELEAIKEGQRETMDLLKEFKATTKNSLSEISKQLTEHLLSEKK